MTKSTVLRIAAKALIISKKGKLLILRESDNYVDGTQQGRYHLPGGRLHAGETYESTLKREVKEESGLNVEPLYPIYVGEWYPVISGVPHQIIAIFTVCKAKSKKVRLSSEHDNYQWIDPKDASKFDIMDPEPDVIKRYLDWRSGVDKW